jgi:signal transduction histidine kinase/CHASE3 domain sensor protein
MDDVRRMEEQQFAAEHLLNILVDAETGQRGYLASGDREFLDVYDRSLGAWEGAFQWLVAATAGDSGQQAKLRGLRAVILRKLTEMDETLRAYERGVRDGALATLMKPGKATMDEIRGSLAEMFPRASVQSQGRRIRQAREVTFLSFGSTLVFAAMIAVLWHQRRRELDRALRAEGETSRLLHQLSTLDRVSLAVLEQKSVAAGVDETLSALLAVLVETTPAADFLVVLLTEGEELRVRAAVGFPEEEVRGVRIPLGRSLAGQIASERRPLMVKDAARNPRLALPFLQKYGARALYGVPLLDGVNLIGVAEIGSRTREDFSEEEKFVFQSIAGRAAGFLAQAQVHEQERRNAEAQRRMATELRTLLAEAERRTAELDAIINSIPDALYVGDTTGIKLANRRGLELLGADSPAELNQNMEALAARTPTYVAGSGTLVPPGEWVFVRALHGEAAEMDVRIQDPRTGEDRILRSSAAPIRVGGDIVGALAIHVDITERKRLEAEMQKRIDFEQYLIGIVSHDLRTPITSILLSTQSLLRHHELPDKQTKAVVRIQNSAERAARMIADLLDFTSTRSGTMPIHRRTIDIHELLQRVIAEVRVAFADREASIDFRGEADACVDPDRFAQVVTNLARNALTYSPAGTPVEIVTENTRGGVVLSVHNTGEPIPPEKLERIFEPMQRASGAGSEQRNIGLGLYIVNAIMKAHDGTIEVTSSGDNGTTFTARFPRVASECEKRSEQADPESGGIARLLPVSPDEEEPADGR